MMDLNAGKPISKFQSTLSMRRATIVQDTKWFAYQISIHALHEESDRRPQWCRGGAFRISIHALHEESDFGRRVLPMALGISIHALHEESDSTTLKTPIFP